MLDFFCISGLHFPIFSEDIEPLAYTSLRNMVAKSTDPVYHCLIDTGALVMGFTNEEVAKLLLKLLPDDLFEP